MPRSAAVGQLCVLPAPMVAAILPRDGRDARLRMPVKPDDPQAHL